MTYLLKNKNYDFINTTTNSERIVSWMWSVNGTDVSNFKDMSKMFDTSGAKAIKLVGTDRFGQTVEVTKTLTVITESLPEIYTENAPDGVVGTSYNYTFKLIPRTGTGPFTWGCTPGSLPDGLTLDINTGVVSGQPTVGGTFMPIINVTDSIGNTVPAQNVTFTIYAKPVIDTTVVPDTAPSGVSYSFTPALVDTHIKGPVTWSLPSATIDALSNVNLSFNASTGAISGTPSDNITIDLAYTVTDSFSPTNSDSKTLSLHIYDALALAPVVFPDGLEGEAYTSSPDIEALVSGGVPGYTITITGLPSGTSYNPTTHKVEGTPDAGTAANSPY